MPTRSVNNNSSLDTKVAVILNDVGHIREEIGDIKMDLQEQRKEAKENYIRKEEFDPVKRIVYGLVGLILVAVVGAIIALVVIQPTP